MTETKFFEIRDVGTHIPAMCTLVHNTGEWNYQMRRAGWGPTGSPLVFFLTNLVNMETNYDEFSWKSPRTMPNAHRCIKTHWGILSSGDVIDVEFFLGETTTKKTSERFTTYGETA